MKNLKSGQAAAEFGPETRFKSNQVPTDGHGSSRTAVLEELKQRLFHEKARTTSDEVDLAYLRRAAEEAAALAWATPYPLLVLPELFAEKAAEARFQSERQREIRERSQGIVALAV